MHITVSWNDALVDSLQTSRRKHATFALFFCANFSKFWLYCDENVAIAGQETPWTRLERANGLTHQHDPLTFNQSPPALNFSGVMQVVEVIRVKRLKNKLKIKVVIKRHVFWLHVKLTALQERRSKAKCSEGGFIKRSSWGVTSSSLISCLVFSISQLLITG